MVNRITDAQLSNAAVLVRQSMLTALAQDEVEDYEFSELFRAKMQNIVENEYGVKVRRRGILRNSEEPKAINCPDSKGNVLPKPKRIIVIAAVIIAMTMLVGYTVLNGADWFRYFFEKKLQQPLSPAQNEFIDRNTIDVNQIATANGYTLTIEYAIADSRNAYIKLRLEGPINEPLDADFYVHTPRELPDKSGLEPTFFKVNDPTVSYGAGTWEMLEDGNANDNSVSILWILNQAGSHLPSFEENVLYKIHLTDWIGYYEDEGIDQPIAENGVFDFYITFNSLNQDVLNFISTPITTAHNDFSVEITSFQLNTMSGSATYIGREDEKGVFCLIDSFVMLKNGTEVQVKPRHFGTGFCDFVLSSPVVLSEVDYVQLRDGTKLYASEQR